jgi:hypothetical protein
MPEQRRCRFLFHAIFDSDFCVVADYGRGAKFYCKSGETDESFQARKSAIILHVIMTRSLSEEMQLSVSWIRFVKSDQTTIKQLAGGEFLVAIDAPLCPLHCFQSVRHRRIADPFGEYCTAKRPNTHFL